jgi:hypothetical protein
MRIAGTVAIAFLAAAAPLWAVQEPPASDPAAAAPSAGTPSAGPTQDILPANPVPDPTLPARTAATIDRKNQVVVGLGFGGPLGAALQLDLLHGLAADVSEERERVSAVCAVPLRRCARGFLLGAEAGYGGGKLSLGVAANARVDSEDFRGKLGVGFRLSLARTWGSPIGTASGLTYLGPELDLYVLRFGVDLGVLWRVSGAGGASALFTWGLGIRL